MPFWEAYEELVIKNLRWRIQEYITIANYIISELLELCFNTSNRVFLKTVIPFKYFSTKDVIHSASFKNLKIFHERNFI